MPTIYEDTAEDDVLADDDLSAIRRSFFEFSESASMADLIGLLQPVVESVSDTATISTTAAAPGLALILREQIGLVATQTSELTFGLLLQELIRLRDGLGAGHSAILSDTATMADLLSTVRGLVVIEQMGISDVLLPAVIRAMEVGDQARIVDLVLRFFGAEAEDTATLAAATTTFMSRRTVLSDTMQLTDTLASLMVLRLEASDTATMTPAQALQALYAGVLTDTMQVEALVVSPTGFTTWAVNTRLGAVTEYRNFAFNSFARMGAVNLGANESGLFELTGDDDDGDPIVASIKGGRLQMNGSRFTGLKAVYLGIRGEGEFFLRLEAGSGQDYVYRLVARDSETTKVWTGKGLRHRYLSYELTSVGQDFDLDTIEFVPMRAQRRV